MLPSRRRARKAQPASSTPSTSGPVEASVFTAPQAANHKVDLERWWRYAAIPAKTTMAILTSSTAFQADGCPECTESGWALVRQDLVQPGTHRTGCTNCAHKRGGARDHTGHRGHDHLPAVQVGLGRGTQEGRRIDPITHRSAASRRRSGPRLRSEEHTSE